MGREGSHLLNAYSVLGAQLFMCLSHLVLTKTWSIGGGN